MPNRIHCVLFVVNSEANASLKNYALLPQENVGHPICQVFLNNNIQIVTNDLVSLSKNVTYKIVETFLDELEPSDTSPPRLYVNKYNHEFIKKLLKNGGFKIVTRFQENLSAITEENLKVMNKFATSKVNIQYSHPKGGSLMHFAAKIGDTKLISLLKKCKLNINANSENNTTPLHFAVEAKCRKTCEFLLEEGAKIDSKISDGSTALHLASEKGALDIIKLLIEKNACIEAKRQDGLTPLHIAVVKGYTQVVEYLLQYAFANINSTVNSHGSDSPVEGAHPLHFAVMNNRLEITKLLLERGANVDAETANGTSVLSFAVSKGLDKMVSYLLSQKPSISSAANKTAFLNAFKKSKGDLYGEEKDIFIIVIGKMLAYGFDVGPEDVNEPDVLFGAIYSSLFEIVQKLVNYGANVNQLHSFMRFKLISPLHLAVLHANNDIIQLLLEHNANPNAKSGSKFGNTPLLYAIEKGNVSAVELLLASNANVRDSPSPLLFVLGDGNYDSEVICKYAGMYEMKKERHRTVELLLENGADMNVRSSSRKTPMSIALKEDDLKTAIVFMKFGVHFSFTDVASNTTPVILQAVLDYGFADLSPTDRSRIKKLFNLYEKKVVKDSAKTLACHIVKTEAAHKTNDARELIPTKYYKLFNLRQFKDDCKAEISRLKSVKIGQTNLTFYDVLTKSVKQVACYARSEDFVETLEYHDTKRRFPIYGCILDCRIRHGVLRQKLLKEAMKIFKSLFSPDFSSLPYDVKEGIVDRLNNQDILVLKNTLKKK